jgi:dephospho-CoA kinase
MEAAPVLGAHDAIGLTGGIGSGKSTVAAMLARCGAAIVDTDAIARALTGPAGLAMPAVAEAFGAGFVTPDGALDRSRMRTLAFAEPAAKARLEALLHPLIGEQALHQAAAARQMGRPVVFDVPLLTESSAWRGRVARLLVVDCSVGTQLARVAARPGWDEATARSVVSQQASRERRRAIADAVLHNDGVSLERLEQQVRALWKRWHGTPAG